MAILGHTYICLAECRVVETLCPMLCPMFASLCPLWPHRYHAHITDAELSDRAISISLWKLIENKEQLYLVKARVWGKGFHYKISL